MVESLLSRAQSLSLYIMNSCCYAFIRIVTLFVTHTHTHRGYIQETGYAPGYIVLYYTSMLGIHAYPYVTQHMLQYYDDANESWMKEKDPLVSSVDYGSSTVINSDVQYQEFIIYSRLSLLYIMSS